MYQTVIFDLDGTLLNTIDDLANAGNHVCRENGWPEHTAAEFCRMVGHGIPNLVSRFSPPEGQAPEILADTLRRFSAYYAQHNMDATAPYEGIPAMLERLKLAGVQMAVYSNKADEFSQVIISRYFPDTFVLVRGKVEGVPVKPDPTGVRGVLAELGADVTTTLFVGDSAVDIQTAHNAGLMACGVTWGFRGREELEAAGADRMVDTAAQLEQVIME